MSITSLDLVPLIANLEGAIDAVHSKGTVNAVDSQEAVNAEDSEYPIKSKDRQQRIQTNEGENAVRKTDGIDVVDEDRMFRTGFFHVVPGANRQSKPAFTFGVAPSWFFIVLELAVATEEFGHGRQHLPK
eukprot:Clim_evm15s233 gene=Clim_evmTU15s233